jgi:hypothetical protein
MYEIWLVLNILWELALGVWPLLVAGLVAWGVLMAVAARRHRLPWGRALGGALLIGAVAAVVAFTVVPGLTRSSLGELRYWVDWANLLGIALAVGGIVAAYAWPLVSLRRPSSR